MFSSFSSYRYYRTMPRENKAKFASNFARCFALESSEESLEDDLQDSPRDEEKANKKTSSDSANKIEQNYNDENIIYSSDWKSSDCVSKLTSATSEYNSISKSKYKTYLIIDLKKEFIVEAIYVQIDTRYYFTVLCH